MCSETDFATRNVGVEHCGFCPRRAPAKWAVTAQAVDASLGPASPAHHWPTPLFSISPAGGEKTRSRLSAYRVTWYMN